MTATVRYELYDVFTDEPFTGNPLAVAIDPPALDTGQCAAIARELNLSETVFCTTGGTGGVDTRIFTPGGEVPFAGHPTIGAALALDDAGMVTDGSITLHEGIGPVVVDVVDGRATLTTAVPPTRLDDADAATVADRLGLRPDDLDPDHLAGVWSTGLAFTMVVVRDVATLGRIEVSTAMGDGPVYALAADDADNRWRARMFAPGLGIPEDPATGSAAAAACGFLEVDETGIVIRQGVEMGRPSTIEVGAVVRDGRLVAARVGGRAVRVGCGELAVPR